MMALNPWQVAIRDRAKQLGITEQSLFNNPEQINRLVTEFYGEITLPAGIAEGQVISRSPIQLEYRDAEGYTHRLRRELHGGKPTVGSVEEISTDRPNILPQAAGELDVVKNLLQQFSSQLQGQAGQQQTGLSPLDPETLSALEQISAAENQQLQQSFQQGQGALLAQLFGQGVPQSSIATQAGGRLLQEQGLVQSQAQGQQAQRRVDLQGLLTQLGQQREQFEQQSLQSFITDILGQGVTRETAGGQIGVAKGQTAEQARQFDRNLMFQMEQFEEATRQARNKAKWDKIFKGITAGVSILGAPFTGGASLAGLGKSGTSSASGGGGNVGYGGGSVFGPS